MVGLVKPLHRTWRPNTAGNGRGYIINRDFAQSPAHYVRAFLLIPRDLLAIFEYVEPSDLCAKTYSHRIHALLMRTVH